MAKKRRKAKIKVVTRTIVQRPSINAKELKEDIASLEKRKEAIKAQSGQKKGLFGKVGGFLATAGVNAQIRERQMALRQPVQLQNIKSRIELERARGELNELRKRNAVNFDSLGGVSAEKKQVRFEDVFK